MQKPLVETSEPFWMFHFPFFAPKSVVVFSPRGTWPLHCNYSALGFLSCQEISKAWAPQCWLPAAWYRFIPALKLTTSPQLAQLTEREDKLSSYMQMATSKHVALARAIQNPYLAFV